MMDIGMKSERIHTLRIPFHSAAFHSFIIKMW